MVKTQIKKFEQALDSGDLDKANEQFRLTVKKLDKIAAKGTMHKNTVARKKSKLAKMLKGLAEKKG
jgi:small subunit ribosomal protein S20